MDTLQLELAKLRRDANLTQSIEDIDKIIAQLERARESIVAGTGQPISISTPDDRRATDILLFISSEIIAVCAMDTTDIFSF